VIGRRRGWSRRDPVTVASGGWAALVYAFLYRPILTVVVYSFNTGARPQIWRGFGTLWYARALANENMRAAVWVSVQVATLTALVSVILGTAAGVALARRGGGWAKPFVLLLSLILVTPEIVSGIAYLIWFVRIDIDTPLARYVIGHSVFGSAVVTMIVWARLRGLDESLEQAAADLGATPWRAFRDVTLPLMRPAVIAGGLLAFTFSLDDVVISSFVSTAGRFTLPVYLFSSLRMGLRGDVLAISSLMLLVTLFAIACALVVLRRSGDTAEDAATTIVGGGR
jgi:putrescine transport system permease protein